MSLDEKWSEFFVTTTLNDTKQLAVLDLSAPVADQNQIITALNAKSYFQTPLVGNISAAGNTIDGLGGISFDDVNTGITQSALNLLYDVDTSGAHNLRVADTIEYSFNEIQADFKGNNIVNLGTLNTNTIPTTLDTFAMLGVQNIYTAGMTQFFQGTTLAAPMNINDADVDLNANIGDFWKDDNFLKYRPSTGSNQILLGDTLTQVITNKTISAVTNTISDITNSELDTGVFAAITGIGVQTQDFDINNNTFLNLISLGIGTNAPLQALDVVGSIRASNAFVSNDGSTQAQAAIPSNFDIDVNTSGLLTQFDHNTADNNLRNIRLSSNGKFMFTIGIQNTSIYRFDLAIPGDISSAPTTPSQTFPVGGAPFNEAAPHGLFVSTNGKKIYFTGLVTDTLFELDLGTAFDLTTATDSGNTFPFLADSANARGISFNLDGSLFYMATLDTPQGILVYPVPVDGDVSSIVAGSFTLFNTTSFTVDPLDITFKADGRQAFLIEGTNDLIFQLDMPDPYNLFSAAAPTKTFDVTTEEPFPRGVNIDSFGKNFYVSGGTGNIFQYDINRISRVGVTVTEIFSLDDLPSDVAGVITLPTGLYLFKNSIDFGTNRIEVAAGATAVTFKGEGDFNSALSSSLSANTFITAAGGGTTILFEDLNFVFTGTTIEFLNVNLDFLFVDGITVTFNGGAGVGTQKLGTITSSQAIILDNITFRNFNEGFTIPSANGIQCTSVLGISNFVTAGADTMWDIQALTQRASFLRCTAILNSNESFFGFANTITNRITLDGNNLTTSTNFYAAGTLTQKSPNVIAASNSGSPDSLVIGGFFSNGVTTLTVLNNITYTDLIFPATRTSFSYNEGIAYAGLSNGEIEYTADQDTSIIVPFAATIDPSVGSDASIQIKLLINRGAGYVDLPDLVETEIFFKGTNVSGQVFRRADVQKGDKVKWQAIQGDGTTNITIIQGDIMI